MNEPEMFLNGCKGRGPLTLEDHLTLAGYTEFRKRRAIQSKVAKLLRDSEEFRPLVGTVIFPSAGARGKAPAWAGDTEPRPNKEPIPDYTQVPALHVMHEAKALISSGAGQDAIERLIVLASREGDKKQAIVAQAIAEVKHAMDIRDERIRMESRHNAELVEVLSQLKESNAYFLERLRREDEINDSPAARSTTALARSN